MRSYTQKVSWHGVRLKVTYECQTHPADPEVGIHRPTVEPVDVIGIEVIDTDDISIDDLIDLFDENEAKEDA